MSVVFAYRSTRTKAWFSNSGGEMGAAYNKNGSTVAPFIADNTDPGVFGGKVLRLGDQGVMCGPIWPGFQNTPDTGPFAVLMRIVPYWTGAPVSQDLIAMGMGTQASNCPALINLLMLSNGSFRLRWDQNGDGNATSTTTGAGAFTGFVAGVPVDIMLSWDNEVAGSTVFWSVDGVLVGQSSAPNFFLTGMQKARGCISMGVATTSAQNHYDINEIVIFDHNENPVYSPRTDFWPIAEFDGTENTDPGVANVRDAVLYKIDGTPLTGTLSFPAVEDIRDGVSGGTLEVPDEADVREGTAYDGGRLGTLDLVRESVTVEVAEDEVVIVNVEEI